MADAAGLCASGRRQSPIDIGPTDTRALPALQFQYQPTALKLANDGSTLRVRMAQGSHLRIGAGIYALQQFHFHTPGGETVAGQAFPMIAHLLHRSAAGQLLAVGVHMRSGAHNALMETLLAHLPARTDGDHAIPGVAVNATALLPAQTGYFRYTGSLTASPCTEGVEWIILKAPIEISAAQLARYHSHFADNMRGPQPLNRRVVLESA